MIDELGKYTVDFSRVLNQLLKERRMRQTQLADVIGVSRQAVSFYCSGKVIPEWPILLKIANFFQVSLEYLITGYQPEDKSIKEELKLSSGAIEKLKSVASDDEFISTFPFIDNLLSDDKFFECFKKAVELLHMNWRKMFCLTGLPSVATLDEIDQAKLTEAALVITELGEYKVSRLLTDYFIDFFKRVDTARYVIDGTLFDKKMV